jgi:hypothetical protein
LALDYDFICLDYAKALHKPHPKQWVSASHYHAIVYNATIDGKNGEV